MVSIMTYILESNYYILPQQVLYMLVVFISWQVKIFGKRDQEH